MKPTEFLDALRASKVGAAVAADAAKRQLAERQAHVDAIAAVEAEQLSSYAQLNAAVDVALERRVAATRALQDAERAVSRAAWERTSASFEAQTRRGNAEAALRESASPLIGEFISEMISEAAAARRALGASTKRSVNPITRKSAWRSTSNIDSVKARIDAIECAIVKAGELALAADQSEIEKQLHALRAGLPAVREPDSI